MVSDMSIRGKLDSICTNIPQPTNNFLSFNFLSTEELAAIVIHAILLCAEISHLLLWTLLHVTPPSSQELANAHIQFNIT